MASVRKPVQAAAATVTAQPARPPVAKPAPKPVSSMAALQNRIGAGGMRQMAQGQRVGKALPKTGGAADAGSAIKSALRAVGLGKGKDRRKKAASARAKPHKTLAAALAGKKTKSAASQGRVPARSRVGQASGTKPVGGQPRGARIASVPPPQGSAPPRKAGFRIVPGGSTAAKHAAARVIEMAVHARENFIIHLAGRTQGLLSRAEQAQQMVRSEVAQRGHALKAIFARSRSQLDSGIAAAQAQLRALASARQAALFQAQLAETAHVAALFSDGQVQVGALGGSYAGRGVQTAEVAAAMLRSTVEHRAYQAWEIGQRLSKVNSDPAVIEAKKRASFEISNEAAGAILDGLDDAEESIRDTGVDTAQAFREQTAEFAVALGEGKGGIIVQLWSIFEDARQIVRRTAASGVQQLGELGLRARRQLQAAERGVLAQIQQDGERKGGELRFMAALGMAVLQRQAGKALDVADARVDRLTKQIAQVDLPQSQVPLTVRQASGDIDAAFGALALLVEAGSARLAGAVGAFASNFLRALDSAIGGVTSRLAATAAALAGRAAAYRDLVIGQVQGLASKAVTAAADALAQVASKIQSAVAKIGTGFQKVLDEYRADLAAQIAEADVKAREPLVELNQQILAAQRKIAEQAEMSSLGKQFADAWEMIKDPGFWAAVVVGIGLTILAVLLLPEGLAFGLILLIGAGIAALAAAVGSIVGQAMDHKFGWHWDWSLVDWEQVGISFVQGALAGAAMAALIVLVPGAAGIAGISLATGAITIVTNLIMGERWDKGLLANMAFAALFARLGRYLPRRKGSDGSSKDGKSGKKGETGKDGKTGKSDIVEEPAKTSEQSDDKSEVTKRLKTDEPGIDVKPPVKIGGITYIEVDTPTRIRVTTPKLDKNGSLSWELYESESGATFSLVHAEGGVLGHPEQYLLPHEAILPNGEPAVLTAKGFSWTFESLKINRAVWEEWFGTRLENYGGQIVDKNLRLFQKEYVKARATLPGENAEIWNDIAIRKVPFGKHRQDLGFGDLKVRPTGRGKVNIDGVWHEDVPTRVLVDAKRQKP